MTMETFVSVWVRLRSGPSLCSRVSAVCGSGSVVVVIGSGCSAGGGDHASVIRLGGCGRCTFTGTVIPGTHRHNLQITALNRMVADGGGPLKWERPIRLLNRL